MIYASRVQGFGLVSLCLLILSFPGRTEVARPGSATFALVNGRVVTMEDRQPRAEAIAAVAGRIVAVGDDDEIRPLIGPDTRVIDAEQQLVIPAFIEGHGHFMELGWSLRVLDVSRAGTWDEIIAMVGQAAARAKPGEWIIGQGWHQDKWTTPPTVQVEGMPVHARLSAVSPDNPVWLGHASGHGAFVNARALQLARIGPDTVDPPGGHIARDPQGLPTGWLNEEASQLVWNVYRQDQAALPPAMLRAEMLTRIRLAGAEALSKGITTFHDAGVPFSTVDLYRELAAAGELPLRLYVMLREKDNAVLAEKLDAYRVIGAGNNFLTVRAIKRMVDGALGSRGAWLLEPYSDDPGNTGIVVDPVAMIAATAELAIAHGYQLATHAIGDRANREILNVYEHAFATHPGETDRRWRIEHAQHLHPDDVPRFARLGVIASMQGVHAVSDGPWMPKRLGTPRTGERTYLWRSLWDSGAIVTNGTDVPVEDIDPIASFHASVTRRLADGSLFFPEQCLTREEALRSYTLNNAYAAFEEDIKGSLAPGKLADIVVLSRDILTVPEDQIPGTRVVYTILGGQVVYDHGKD